MDLNIRKTDRSPGFIGTVDQAREAGIPDDVVDAALANATIVRATAEIDRLGDKLSVCPSRTARYQQKQTEARAYIDAGRPSNVSVDDFPILTTEAAARDMTKGDLADAILSRALGFAQIMAMAEGLRAQLPQLVAAGGTALDDALARFRAVVTQATS